MRQRRDEHREDLDPPPLGRGGPRACAVLGCAAVGEFKAPRSRDTLRDYQWLCLEHVRAFNKSWDFFNGMSTDEIEQHRREDVTWHRPTWRTTVNGLTIDDPLGILGEDAEPPPARPRLETQADKMLRRLGLSGDADLAALKRRYKLLVKRHHPDLHGGDPAAVERLKLINEAYSYLLHCGALA
ncbi:MAG: J domain-containing protein [Pseudomonadota bacterium]